MGVVARVSGAHPGAFSNERVYIQRLTVREETGRVSRNRKLVLKRAVPFVILFLALLLQLFVRVQILHAGYQLSEKRSEALELDRELRELRSQLAEATSPKILLSRAEKELGLGVTPPQRLRTLPRGGVER